MEIIFSCYYTLKKKFLKGRWYIGGSNFKSKANSLSSSILPFVWTLIFSLLPFYISVVNSCHFHRQSAVLSFHFHLFCHHSEILLFVFYISFSSSNFSINCHITLDSHAAIVPSTPIVLFSASLTGGRSLCPLF